MRYTFAALATLSLLACAAEPPPPVVTPDEEGELHEEKAEHFAGLDPDQISPVVKNRYPAFRGCHTMEYGGGAMSPGSVVLEWEVQADGSVGKAKVAESSFENPKLNSCLVGVMKDLQFPHAPGTTEVSWRFKFRGRE